MLKGESPSKPADFTGKVLCDLDLSGAIFRGVQGYAEAKGLDHVENVDKIVR